MDDGYYSITKFYELLSGQAENILKKFNCVPSVPHTSESYSRECEELNSFLVRDAYKYEKNNLLKTTLLVKSDEIIGFISLCTGTTKLTKQYRKGHKIFYAGIDEYPTVNVTHFAIDNRYQHTAMHYGHVIFNDTLKRIANGVVSVVGVTLIMVVEALEEARPFYEKGFSFQVHDSRNTNGKVNLAITIPELKIVVNG